MTDRELMQQALEALEEISGGYSQNLIAALKERLAQPNIFSEIVKDKTQRTHWEGCEEVHPECRKQEQEPVAWKHTKIEDNIITHRPSDIDRHPERWTALYPEPKPCPTCEALARTVMLDQTSHDTAPPQRKPLTDEAIIKIGNNCRLKAKPTSTGIIIHPVGMKEFARAIEAAHNIKGEA